MKRRGMALGLAALMTCTALFTTTAKAENKGSDEKETIKFTYWGSGDEKKAIEESVDKFMEANPNIEVDLMHIPSEDFLTKLNAMIAAGEAPDVSYSASWKCQMGEDGLIYNFYDLLDDMGLSKDDYLSTCWWNWSPTESAGPVQANVTTNLMYNVDCFEEAGVDLPPTKVEEAWSWDEFVEITVLGIVVFLFYANSIFMKFQMGEIGIFLSLGMPPKAVTKMHNKQFDLVFTFSGVIGVVLSIPFAFAVWSFLTLFLSYTDHTFTIGWQGIFIAILIWISAWGILRLKNTISLSKADVIKILHSSSENEEVKGAKPILGLLGLFAIPMGVILFNITAVIDGLKTISMLFLVISLIGGYLLTAQITTIGTLVKRFFPKAYRKNILFYNLVRQKGNQYTLSLFVSSLLIALTVFFNLL